MSRTLPTGYAALTETKKVFPAFFVELDWPDGLVHMWSGYGSIVWDGKTFVGAGKLGSVSEIVETKDGKPNGMTLTINGIPSDLLAEATRNDTQGRSAKVWLAGLTPSAQIDVAPYQIHDGVINVCPIQDDGTTGSISIHLEKDMYDRRVKERRNTHEDQQIDYPGDTFFEHTAATAVADYVWGGKSEAGNPRPTGSGSSKGFFGNIIDPGAA
jgi:hypothetical protein